MTIILVHSLNYLSVSAIFLSVSRSKDEVGSSSNMIFDFFSKALIKEIRCFYPPEKMFPFSPTFELYPLGSFEMVSWRLNFFANSSIYVKLASG